MVDFPANPRRKIPPGTATDPHSALVNSLNASQRETLIGVLDMGPDVVARLVRIASEDEKREWLYALSRKWAAGIAAFITAVLLLKEQVASMVKSFWWSP